MAEIMSVEEFEKAMPSHMLRCYTKSHRWVAPNPARKCTCGWQNAVDAYRNQAEALRDAAAKSEKEKQTRIKYQGIVYDLCNLADRSSGSDITKGQGCTIDTVRDVLDTQIRDARAEIDDIRQRLGGLPESRLDGEGGLAAATMRKVGLLRQRNKNLRRIAGRVVLGSDAEDILRLEAEIERLAHYFWKEDAQEGNAGDLNNDSTVTTAIRVLRERKAEIERLHR